DLLGRGGRPLGQRAHLGGDHGEAAALLAGTCRFHRRVQRQDVGLEGDAVDHRDDVGDLARGGLDVGHGGDHLAHDLTTLGGDRGGADGQLVGLAGVVGVLLDGGGQLLHRGGGLFQVGGLLLGATRQVVVAGGDLGGAGVDRRGGVLDARDDRGQLVDGGVGVVAHAGEHAAEVAFHAHGQVAVGQALEHDRDLLCTDRKG